MAFFAFCSPNKTFFCTRTPPSLWRRVTIPRRKAQADAQPCRARQRQLQPLSMDMFNDMLRMPDYFRNVLHFNLSFDRKFDSWPNPRHVAARCTCVQRWSIFLFSKVHCSRHLRSGQARVLSGSSPVQAHKASLTRATCGGFRLGLHCPQARIFQ